MIESIDVTETTTARCCRRSMPGSSLTLLARCSSTTCAAR